MPTQESLCQAELSISGPFSTVDLSGSRKPFIVLYGQFFTNGTIRISEIIHTASSTQYDRSYVIFGYGSLVIRAGPLKEYDLFT